MMIVSNPEWDSFILKHCNVVTFSKISSVFLVILENKWSTYLANAYRKEEISYFG